MLGQRDPEPYPQLSTALDEASKGPVRAVSGTLNSCSRTSNVSPETNVATGFNRSKFSFVA